MVNYLVNLLLSISILTSFKSSEDLYTKTSYYSIEHHNKRTASSEKFNMYALTAAHKTLKFGTFIEVTNLRNNKSIVVRVNDRGPYVKGRNLDLSYQAFKKLENPKVGVISIKYNILN